MRSENSEKGVDGHERRGRSAGHAQDNLDYGGVVRGPGPYEARPLAPHVPCPTPQRPALQMRRGTDVVACTGCVRFSLGDVESVDEGGQQRVAK